VYTTATSRLGKLAKKHERKLLAYDQETRSDLVEILNSLDGLPEDEQHIRGFEALKMYWGSEEDWIQNSLWIATKKRGAKVLFRYNAVQRKVNQIIDRIEMEDRPVRLIILKARQMGFSTYIQARLFGATCLSSGVHAFTVGNKKSTTKNLMNMCRRYLGNLIFKPQMDEEAKTGLVFAHDSSLTIETARAGDETGRSAMAHMVHLSELAFYPDPEAALTAVLQIQGDGPGTWTIVESTANGAGNFFHQLWLDAEEGRNDFIPLFFPWFEDPEYRMEIPDGSRSEFEKSLNDEEKELLNRFELDLEQLFWRRWAIRNKCRNSIEVFHQEYPSTAEEAFLHSGAPVFDIKRIMELEKRAVPPERFVLGLRQEE